MEDGLEIERQEVSARDKDTTVAEADEQGGDVGAVFEEAQRHDGVDCKLPLVKKKEKDCDEAEYYKTKNCCGSPGVGYAAVFEAKEEHDCTANNSDGAQPVDGAEAGEERCFGGFDVQEKENYHEGESVEGD